VRFGGLEGEFWRGGVELTRKEKKTIKKKRLKALSCGGLEVFGLIATRSLPAEETAHYGCAWSENLLRFS